MFRDSILQFCSSIRHSYSSIYHCCAGSIHHSYDSIRHFAGSIHHSCSSIHHFIGSIHILAILSILSISIEKRDLLPFIFP
ncbi:hypothetical protein ABH966_003027 [Lysinibacillus sp. RC46]|uniref:hypothetical protein n=1 Tax=Lysinibacillus sp. RC46 TaxID=3156295 RepID=UPI003513CE15